MSRYYPCLRLSSFLFAQYLFGHDLCLIPTPLASGLSRHLSRPGVHLFPTCLPFLSQLSPTEGVSFQHLSHASHTVSIVPQEKAGFKSLGEGARVNTSPLSLYGSRTLSRQRKHNSQKWETKDLETKAKVKHTWETKSESGRQRVRK